MPGGKAELLIASPHSFGEVLGVSSDVALKVRSSLRVPPSKPQMRTIKNERKQKCPETGVSKRCQEMSKTEMSKTEMSKTEMSKTEMSKTEISKA